MIIQKSRFKMFMTTFIYHLNISHQEASIFNENKRFLGKVIFIPPHSCLRGRYTWYSDFPTFRCPFCSTKRPSLRNTPRFPRWLPHSIWISFPGATAWGLGTDNSRWVAKSGEYDGWATNSNRNCSNSVIVFKDVCDGALSWWYRTFFFAIWGRFFFISSFNLFNNAA